MSRHLRILRDAGLVERAPGGPAALVRDPTRSAGRDRRVVGPIPQGVVRSPGPTGGSPPGERGGAHRMIDDGSTDGEVTRLAAQAVIRFERHLPVPPPVVWVALTDPAFLSKWWVRSPWICVWAGNSTCAGSTPRHRATGSPCTPRSPTLDPPHLLETTGDVHGILRWELATRVGRHHAGLHQHARAPRRVPQPDVGRMALSSHGAAGRAGRRHGRSGRTPRVAGHPRALPRSGTPDPCSRHVGRRVTDARLRGPAPRSARPTPGRLR